MVSNHRFTNILVKTYIYISKLYTERERRNSKYTYIIIVIVILQQIISIKINVYTFQILRSSLLFIISIIFVF